MYILCVCVCVFVTEVCCSADEGIFSNTSEKENIYGQLLQNLQHFPANYKFTFIPLIIGVLGYVIYCLTNNVKIQWFQAKKRPSNKPFTNKICKWNSENIQHISKVKPVALACSLLAKFQSSCFIGLLEKGSLLYQKIFQSLKKALYIIIQSHKHMQTLRYKNIQMYN
ncbi:Hypothetical predicted protein [Octopus vulgaris]|uniref:Uncharacterized protein n=1 Tax=Octopus vulgaris TaxID=6645 RepID=A0AA36BH63_OCTVU|nr:Hypothetical predicted protein [Octopus vulgaris]